MPRRSYVSSVAGSNAVEVTAAGTEVGSRVALLSAVADPVRWTVLHHLALRGETCVCDLQEGVSVPPNLLSYHLKVLRDAGLVTTARRGRWVEYSLAPWAADRLRRALPVMAQVALP